MSEPQSWVRPLTHVPSSLKPFVATQKKRYGDVLHPARWWGRTSFLFWLVTLLIGFLERKKACSTPVIHVLLMIRISQVCHYVFCVGTNSLQLAERCDALDKVVQIVNWQDSTLFSAEERVALAYVDAITAAPPQADDVLEAQMEQHFTDTAITEMAALIAFQNLSARSSATPDIPSQGLCGSFKGRPHT